MLSAKRFRRVSALLLAAFCLLTARLWWLNCRRGGELIALAQNQRLLTVAEREFRRGDLLWRDGEPITNRAERCLLVFPSLARKDARHDAAYYQTFLAALLDDLTLTPAPAAQNLVERLAADEPFLLARGMTETQEQAANERIAGLCGVFTCVWRPRYAASSPAAHLLGYVGPSSAAEYEALTAAGLPDPAYTGKCALEQQYDALLRGRPTAEIAAAVDEQGRQASQTLRELPPGGEDTALDVQLTLDAAAQQIVENAMRGKNGAAVLLDVANGDVLALASSPGFDQSAGQPAAEGDAYLNKAFCYYPPASVFKLVLALAALDNGIGIDDAGFSCDGGITLPNGRTVHCWRRAGHGAEDLRTALANSCNPYFVALGQRLGGELIAEYAWRLGLTEQVLRGMNVPSENRLDFSPAVPADVANVSIGEKGIRTTPLMLARLLAAIANGGKLVEPRLVSALVTAGGRTVQSIESAEPRQVVKPESAQKLREMLRFAVTDGTGAPADSGIIAIAGKTGTSQDFGVWFAGFFPADAPRWAMAVYIADGQSGGSDAGSVCRKTAEKLALLEGIAGQSSV